MNPDGLIIVLGIRPLPIIWPAGRFVATSTQLLEALSMLLV